MIFELLERTIFANKLIDDNRSIENDSLFTFDINVPTLPLPLPLSSSSSSTAASSMISVLFEELSVGGSGSGIVAFTCGILPPNFVFYYQLILIVIIQSIFNGIVGSFVYKIIIEPQQQQQQQQQQEHEHERKTEGQSNKNDDDDDDDGGGDDDDVIASSSNSTSTSTSTSSISASSSATTQATATTTTTPATALLFTFGFALPCVLLEPIYAIKVLQIKNLGLIMVFLTTPIVIPLRIIEAVYGYTPFHTNRNHDTHNHHNTSNNNAIVAKHAATSPINISYWDYIIYFSCGFGIEFNNNNNNKTAGAGAGSVQLSKLKPISKGYFKKRLILIGRDFIIVSILISILKEYNYELFTTPTKHAVPVVHHDSTSSFWDEHSIQDIFAWQHILNNLFVVLLLSTSLSQSSLGVSLFYSICYGYETYEIVLNPMIKSQSISEFWGKRWNVLVHNGLKNGIYKPTRQITSSKIIATITTFIVSGIIHEYVNYVMFYEVSSSSSSSSSYRFRWTQILFFGWHGILIVLEYCIFSRYSIFIWFSTRLPKIIITVLLLYSALPMAHLFTEDWIRYGYFDDICIAEPIIVCSRKYTLE